MRRRRPDLIVPIRDRRQRRRYLTLRNAAKVFIALTVVFAAITIHSELEPRHRDSFGDLFRRELPNVERKPVEVVKEAVPYVEDQAAPDPMLVAPAAREQWLRDGSGATTASIEPVPMPAVAASADGKSRISIVGGPEGVAVVEQNRRRPVLSGGFGR